MSDSFVTPWTVSRQNPLSMGFARQEYWRGLPFPSPGGLPNPSIKLVSPELQVDSLLLSHQGSLQLLRSRGRWDGRWCSGSFHVTILKDCPDDMYSFSFFQFMGRHIQWKNLIHIQGVWIWSMGDWHMKLYLSMLWRVGRQLERGLAWIMNASLPNPLQLMGQRKKVIA